METTKPNISNAGENPSSSTNKRRRTLDRDPKVDRRSRRRITIPAACAPGISQLTQELGLKSEGEAVLWLLGKTRPELVERTVPILKAVPRSDSAAAAAVAAVTESSSSPFRPNPPIVPVDEIHNGPETTPAEPGLAQRRTVRATVVQASTVFFNTTATLDKAERMIAGAAAYGSQLVVFPEAFIGGYPGGEANDEFQKYYTSAIDVPGPEVQRLARIAEKYKVHLVMGVVERQGSTLYSTVIFLDSRGRYLGEHRKFMLKASERIIWCSGDKTPLPVYRTCIGKIGGLACLDNRMPLLRAELYAKGIEIYCTPTADSSDVWRGSMTHIATEGGCFVLSANQFCPRKDYPHVATKLGDADKKLSPDSVVCAGGSMIVSPSGVILAGPNYERESLISADLDIGEIARVKLDFDGLDSTGSGSIPLA